MVNNKLASFVPIGSYRVRIIGVCLFLSGIILKIISLNNKSDIILTDWSIVAGLSFFNFSKEKNENSLSTLNRLISFKIAGMFAINFILAFEFTSAIFKLKFFLPAMTVAFAYNVLFLLSYITLKFINKSIEIKEYEEVTVLENYKLHPKLYIACGVLSVISLFAIFLICRR